MLNSKNRIVYRQSLVAESVHYKEQKDNHMIINVSISYYINISSLNQALNQIYRICP